MTYVKLAFAAAGPVLASAALYVLDRSTAFGKLGRWTKQLIFGLVFGAIAVLATEFGVPIEGAVINARDAAPLCAGLIFGAPAGILAGLIGGVERWFAVLWGAGTYTRLACTVSTIFAGLFGAMLRKWMFDDKKPLWYYGFAIGLVAEVVHMLMIFFTNMDDVHRAFTFVETCSAPMILANALSVMCATLAVSLIGREKLHFKKEEKKLSQTFGKWLLIVVVAAFCATGAFTFALQTRLALRNAESLLLLNIEDVQSDINDASDENLLAITHRIASELERIGLPDASVLLSLTVKHGVAEINLVDGAGRIIASTNGSFVGFDMGSGEQSAAFLPLLDERTEYVQSYQPISYDASIYRKYAGVSLLGGGFVQVGYDAEHFQQDISTVIVGVTRNRHVGQDGCIIIADENWNIVSDRNGNEGKNLAATGVWIDRATMPEKARFETTVYGEPCYCMYTFTEGYYIVSAEPVSEAAFSRNLSVYVTVFMEILIFAALFILIYFLIKKLVVENIQKINGVLGQITRGNLNVAVNVRTNQEFISLSDDINTTVGTLKRYIAEAEARIDAELAFAKAIQHSALPSVFPPYPNRGEFDIFASMQTAKEVGGDFYDFYFVSENTLAFLIADVSGKGIPAAMFMMTAKTLIKSYAESGMEADEALTNANEKLCQGNDAGMFVTAWMGLYNTKTGQVHFANAGHNPPLIKRRGGRFEFLRTRAGFVLAGMEGIKYKRFELTLSPGDEIYLYTDGVTEATDANNVLYGEERLLAVLNASVDGDAQALCESVVRDVDAFVGDAPQFDDITMLSLKIR